MAMTEEHSSATPPLGKYLASTDKKTRDKAVKGLATFLSAPTNNALPKSDMAKLWKGIFYCFWMSDKPLVQQALSSELAGLLLTISSTEASLAFLRGFWEAVVREWNGIDRLRMDKYYMLVRRFVNASFRLLVRAEWDDGVLREYNDILTCRGGPLCSEDSRVPTSLSYHLADIYLEELDKALASESPAFSDGKPTSGPLPTPLSPILSPFFNLSARTNSSVTYQRVYSALVEPLFSTLQYSAAPADAPPRKRLRLSDDGDYSHIVDNSCLEKPKEEGKLESGTLRKALLRKWFDIASGSDARESNRRKMYAVWKAAMAEDEVDGGGDYD